MNQIDLFKLGKNILEEYEVEEFHEKAKKLLMYILQQTAEQYILNSLEEVEKDKQEKYKKAIQDIAKGKPLQYITNHQEFMGLNFYVDENVLIPQPDTEILVEETIKYIKQISKKDKIDVLDLCTGSGAIAISLAKYVENINLMATDISEKALIVAQKNAQEILKESKQIKFILSDLFQNMKNKTFDIIVSNPPYIETNIIPTLDKEVKQEPYIALDGGEFGLDFYQAILEQASNYLNPNGYLLLEIGYNQGEKVAKLLNRKQNLKLLTTNPIKDLGGNDRVMIFQNR